MIVRVPASSANLGPGFDALGLALGMYFECGVGSGDETEAIDGEVRLAEAGHPATKAFRRLGGEGELWLRSSIPPGRGLGFSGSARVAGLLAAIVQQRGMVDRADVQAELLAHAADLEGHADNVAASIYGGVVAVADGDPAKVVKIPLALDPAVVVWVPPGSTSTDESRVALSRSISFEDAVFNVGRTAVLVAALAAGDIDALATATQDRLHQDLRLAAVPGSRHALQVALECGAWCAWLSGSGPAIAALVAAKDAKALGSSLPPEGRVLVLRIDHEGAVVLPG